MRIKPEYRPPAVLAVTLHVALIALLFVHMPAHSYRLPGPTTQPKIVQAKAVSQQQINQQIEKIQQRKHARALAERRRLQKIQAQVAAAKRARVKEQQRIAALKKKQAALKRQAALQKRRRIAAQKKAAKKRLAEQKIRKLQQALMQQQLAAEQKRLNQIRNNQQRGVIDEYRAKILNKLAGLWNIPAGTNRDLRSVFQVHLAPDGTVLSVALTHSSGNAALDRSARTAIVKASPLPVPRDPVVFDNFRELRLTVSPKDVMTG